MANLGDYLGQLMSELVIARVQADLESVRVAELYASHPLLRHMPVPRIRMPEIQMEVPVVIDGAGTPTAGESPRGGVPMDRARKAFDTVLSEHLKANRIRLKADQRAAMEAAVDAETTRRDLPIEVAVDTNGMADRFTKAALASLTETLDEEKVTRLAGRLQSDARLAILALRTSPPRVSASVETGSVKEIGSDTAITRLRLTITEESMELVAVDENGETVDRLVPE